MLGRIPLMVLAVALIATVGCGSDSGDDEVRLSAAEIALATAQANTDTPVAAPKGTGELSAVDVLQRAAEISATLESFRFTTETIVTSGEEVQVGTVNGEWTLPGRYHAISDNPDDPTAEFIVADGQLIFRDRDSDVWRLETEFDQTLGIGSGQLIPNMDVFEFSNPASPDDGEVYRIAGAENIGIEGLSTPIVQTHELVIRVSDFHVESVVSFINPDPEIGLEGTRRVFIVYDRNVPEPIVIPEIVEGGGS